MKYPQEKKCWGIATHVFGSPHAAVSILETELGGYCSRHVHHQRVNRFVVQYGRIEVVTYTPSGNDELSRVSLGPGEWCDVDAGVVHRFEVVEPGLVVEVYFPARENDKVSHDDIVRLDLGGKVVAGDCALTCAAVQV